MQHPYKCMCSFPVAQVQELRGNIRVYVRIKPAEGGVPSVLRCEDGHRIACTAANSTKAGLPCALHVLLLFLSGMHACQAAACSTHAAAHQSFCDDTCSGVQITSGLASSVTPVGWPSADEQT